MDATKTYIDEFFGGCDKISLLELVKIQAKVLIPVIRALRKELGTERANQIVGSSRVDLQACKLEYSIVSPK